METITLALSIILAAENSPDGAISVSKARGAWQIKPIVVQDVNAEYSTNYRPEEMHDFKKGREVAEKLLLLLQKRYPEHKDDVCWLVRAYTVGPKYANREDGYWYYKRGMAKLKETKDDVKS